MTIDFRPIHLRSNPVKSEKIEQKLERLTTGEQDVGGVRLLFGWVDVSLSSVNSDDRVFEEFDIFFRFSMRIISTIF